MKAERSLGSTLSAWLALQSLAGFAAVCVAAYLITAWALDGRQTASMLRKRAQIEHLLTEAAQRPDAPDLQHRIEDVLVGRDDLSFVLRTLDGTALFTVRPERVLIGRQIEFEVRTAAGASMRAELLLDTRDDAALLRNLALTLAVAAVAGAMLISAGGYLLVRRGLAPVRLLVEQTRALAADTLYRRLDGSRQPRELSALIEQINDLLGRLERAYQHLEGFNADVAHELGTPLANLISSTELALRRQRDAQELRDVLGANLEDLQRLANIVQDMLFLSQADRGAKARRTPVASLAALAAHVASYHEAALDEARLGVTVTGDAEGSFDVPLLERALSNMLANVTQHATPGTSVTIDISQHAAHAATIRVINLGESISPSALPRLFERFYRVDASRAHSAQHHGLGLAIVAAIARMHGGIVQATSSCGTTAIGMVLSAAQSNERG